MKRKKNKIDRNKEPTKKIIKGKSVNSTTTSLPLFQRIQTKLIIGYLLPVCCIVVLGIVSYQKASTVIIGNYENSISQTLDMTGQYYTYLLSAVQSQINEYYTDFDINDYFAGLFKISSTKEIQFRNSTIESIKKKTWSNDLLENVFILSKDNESMLTTKAKDEGLYDKFIGTSQGSQTNADPGRYFIFGRNAQMDEALLIDSNESALRIARKFKNTNTCIIADISDEAVRQTLNRLDMGEGSLLGLVSPDGVELLSGMDEVEASLTGEPLFYQKDFYQEAINNEKSNGFQYITHNNQAYMFVYSKIGDTGVVVCAMVPKANIMGQALDIKNITIIIVILACILALITGNYIASGIGKVIKRMTVTLKQAASGDLTVDLNVDRKDEFGVLALDIKNMLSQVKGLIQEVKGVGTALFEEANQVAKSSKVFIESTDHIKTAITEIECGVVQLDENSADCIGQMDQLSGKITLVTDNTTQITAITDKTASAIVNGITTMGELNDKTKSTTEIMENVIATIELLETKSKNIGQIVEVINDIAGQTNLLSLNASIESARAGVYGRGFSVVAEEIRKLADQSLESANQIHAIIEEIIINTADAVKIAKKADVIVTEQKLAVSNTTNSFNTMNEQIALLMEELNSILNNMENMEQARRKTSEAVMSISAVSEETTACSNTVIHTATQQVEASNGLDHASSELLNRAKQLENAINQFTI